MSLRLAARFARRELRGGLRGFRIFLACLALGVMAIAAVGTVRASISAGLESQSAVLLGGDAQAALTYRFASEAERDWMDRVGVQVSEVVDFRSMIVVGQERALTQVKAVDDLYPLVGAVVLDPVMPLDAALADHGAVVERVLADRMGLSVGDTFRMGTQDFTLRAILERYPDNASGGFGLGPRSIVRIVDLQGSGLLAEGTLMETLYRMRLPAGADLQSLENESETLFRDTGMRWRDSRDGGGGAERFVERLGNFLILIGLAGLAVGGVGVSSAVRSYLATKTGVIATLRTLGATRWTVFWTYFLQISALAALGVAVGVIAGAIVPLLVLPLVAAQLPVPVVFAVYPVPLAQALVYGLLTAAVFTLWPLARAGDIRPAALFRDATGTGRLLPRPRYLALVSGLVAVLVGVAIVFTGSLRLTIWTAGGVVTALVVLAMAGVAVRHLARIVAKRLRRRPVLRLALGSVGARGGDALTVVLSLGLGLSVLATVGQIDGNLQRAVADELPSVAPSYFFVDIQPDQIDGFRARLDSDTGVSRYEAAPMLRGVITRINGRPASDVVDHWVIHGDRGLTYAQVPPDGTIVTAGEWWPENYTGAPQISFAATEAAEMGLSLGDEITVNILGRDITATITSFRQVDFSNAGMGFVMSMNPSALAGAPHSWISTVYAAPEVEAPILRDLANAYPNITAIRVRDAIDQAMILIGGISVATRYGALATLVTGFLVLVGAAAAGEKQRTQEAAILKTLGATRGQILRSFAMRAMLTGAAAGVVALGAGIAGGWAVSTYIMETGFAPVWSNAVFVIVAGLIVNLLAQAGFALGPMGVRPSRVLRARE